MVSSCHRVHGVQARPSGCFVAVHDHEEALAFYRDALGLEVRADVKYEGTRWVTVGAPSQPEVNIVLEPPVAIPDASPQDRKAAEELLAKGLLRAVIFATYSLVEAVIHGEDIARPVGRRIDVSPRSLITIAEIARSTDPILGGKRRSAGLTLRASDTVWSVGAGPVVSGPLASIILAITGRPASLDDLSGEGLDTLRPRL